MIARCTWDTWAFVVETLAIHAVLTSWARNCGAGRGNAPILSINPVSVLLVIGPITALVGITTMAVVNLYAIAVIYPGVAVLGTGIAVTIWLATGYTLAVVGVAPVLILANPITHRFVVVIALITRAP